MLERQDILNALTELSDLREFDRFQELIFHLAKIKWPGLRLTRKNHDLGADAIDHDSKLVLACGWNGDLAKLKDDCATISAKREDILKIVFATNKPLQEDTLAKWRSEVKRYGLELVEVIHRDWIIGELISPQNRWLAHLYMGIPIGEFADMSVYLPRIKSSARRILDAALSAQPGNEPELDRRLQAADTESEHFRISDLVERIRPGSFVCLIAEAGAGKTVALLRYARDCLASEQIDVIPIFVSLRHWALQSAPLLEFISKQPALLQQGISCPTLTTALEAGKIVLLLNGLNEIPATKSETLRRELEDISTQLGGATIVATSRRRDETWTAKRADYWTVLPLDDEEIRSAVTQFLPIHPLPTYQAILQHPALTELARIPIFLWEILREADSLHSQTITRFTLIESMVNRASKEYSDALTIENSRSAHNVILQKLAAVMCASETTALSTESARSAISEACKHLMIQMELVQTHSPQLLLNQLISCHLFVSDESSDSYRFSHHLIQEYFAGLHLAGMTSEAIQVSNYQKSWTWHDPIRLGIESLCCLGKYDKAAEMTTWFAGENLAAACLLIGLFPKLWAILKIELEPRIRELSSSEDVNAKWLATRYAASTGQCEFSEIVFSGLGGHPVGSGNPCAGLPIDIVFLSLGDQLESRILMEADEDSRLFVLENLSRSSTLPGMHLATKLIKHDASRLVRRLAYKKLFCVHNARGVLKQFLKEVKLEGGWDGALLELGFSCPEMPLESWRKRQWSFIYQIVDPDRRALAFRRWFSFDPDGARLRLQEQYGWLKHQPEVGLGAIGASFESEDNILATRLWYLRKLTEYEPVWAKAAAKSEAQAVNFWEFGSISGLLTPAELDSTVLSRLSEAVVADTWPIHKAAILAHQSSRVFARWCLLKIIEIDPDEVDSWKKHWPLADALKNVTRQDQIEVASAEEFAHVSGRRLERLFDAMLRFKPERSKQEEISSNLATRWRARILLWASGIPALEIQTASSWCNLCDLLSEIMNADDVPLLISCLLGDFRQLHQHSEQRGRELKNYYESGRMAPAPSSDCPTSHSDTYYQCLHRYHDKASAEKIWGLLNNSDTSAFAAHWLANYHDAPRSEHFSAFTSRHKYELIEQLRVRKPAFASLVASLSISIRGQVETLLNSSKFYPSTDVNSLLFAVARLEGSAAGEWILTIIEGCSEKTFWESLLHDCTLVGVQFNSTRLLPILKRTIQAVRYPQYYNGRDESYRIERAAECLLFSDNPLLGFQLLQDELKSPGNSSRIFENDIADIIHLSRWVEHLDLTSLWDSFLTHASEEIRSAAFDTSLWRAARTADTQRILELGRLFVQANAMLRTKADWSIPSTIAEALKDAPEPRSQLISSSASAGTLEEARRWLRLLSHLGGNDGLVAAFDIAQKWGDSSVSVVSSLAPNEQRNAMVSFSGHFANWRRNLCWNPTCLQRLNLMLSSADNDLVAAASRALNWLARQRLGGGL